MVEKYDFSSGTSSRSTKLIHGGVRYLQKAVFNLDLEQVYDSYCLYAYSFKVLIISDYRIKKNRFFFLDQLGKNIYSNIQQYIPYIS